MEARFDYVRTPKRITQMKRILILTFTLTCGSAVANAQYPVYVPAPSSAPSKTLSTSSDCTQTMADFKKVLAEDKLVKNVTETALTDKSVFLIKAKRGFVHAGGDGKLTFEKTTSGGCLVTSEGYSAASALQKIEKQTKK